MVKFLNGTSKGNTVRTYYPAVEHNSYGGPNTGTIKITLPRSWSNTMLMIELSIFNYSTVSSGVKVILGGYNFASTSSWVNCSAKILGSLPNDTIRFGHDGTKCCILLGTTTTSWSYQKIVIDKILAGQDVIDGWDTDWEISLITDETGITVSGTPSVNAGLNADTIDLLHVSDLTTKATFDEYVNNMSNVMESAEVEATAEVISLPSTVYESELKAVLKGNTATNIIKNGDFSNGTTGWAAYGGTISAADNTLTIIGNGVSSSTNTWQTASWMLNHIYYIRAYVKALSSDCTSITLLSYPTPNTSIKVITPILNEWLPISGVVTAGSTSSSARLGSISFNYGSAALANTKQGQVRYTTAIDLTSTFGTGNEPTVAQCDLMYSEWFDGTKHVGSVRVKSIGKNLIDANEIVIGVLSMTTGEETANAGYFRTGFIPVRELTTYYQKVSSTPTYINTNLFYYDANKEFISQVQEYSCLITPISGCAYIRCVGRRNDTAILTFSDLQAIRNSYQFELGSTATVYESYRETTTYVPAVGKRLPNGVADEIDLNTGKKTQNVSEAYTLQASDIFLNTDTYTNVDLAVCSLSKLAGAKPITTTYVDNNNFYIPLMMATTPDNVSEVGKWYASYGFQGVVFIVAKGTTLAAAQAALAGTVIYYQLAIPIETEISGLGSVMAYPSGSIIIEPIIEFVTKPVNGVLTIPDTNYPISIVESVQKIVVVNETLVYTDITPSSNTSTTITLPSGYDDNLEYRVEYIYEHLSLLPTIEYSYAMNMRSQINKNAASIGELQDNLYDTVSFMLSEFYDIDNDISAHINNTSNPHSVTLEQLSAAPLASPTFTGIVTAPTFYSTSAVITDLVSNTVTSNNSKLDLLSTGAKISRNVADVNSALTVNQVNASSTGNILDLQFCGSTKTYVSTDGSIYTSSIKSFSNPSCGSIVFGTALTSTVLTRSYEDDKTALVVSQENYNSTGRILDLQFNGTIKAYFDKDGILRAGGYKSSDGTAGVTSSFTSSYETSITGTLASASWSGSAAPYTQSVTISGMTSTANGSIGIAQSATAEQRAAAVAAQLSITSQGTNTVTITADGTKPTVDIPIVVIYSTNKVVTVKNGLITSIA